MQISLVHQQAITARIALIVGAEEFDRLFLGVEFTEMEGGVLYVSALNEDLATEMEEKYALHISIIAADILSKPIEIVMVLPKVLV